MNDLVAASRGIDWMNLATVWGMRLLFSLVLLLAGLWLARRLSNGTRSLLSGARVEPILANFFANLLHATILVLVLVTVLDALGVPPTSLLAVMGAAGLAVGLAMKDSLSNIASGVMLIVLRPFRSGDVVEIAGITGVVEQVRLFQTMLRSFENHRIALPNGQITAAPITNFTANATRRVDVPVSVPFGHDIPSVRAALLEIARSQSSVLSDPAADVVVSALSDGSVNLVLRAWVNTPDFGPVRSALLEAVHEQLPKAGFTMAAPRREVRLHLPEGLNVAAGQAPAGSEPGSG